VIGYGDQRPIGQISLFVEFLRISAKGFNMHNANRNKIGAMFFIEAVQIRLVLEEVGVDLTLGHLLVGLDIIGENLDFQINALIFKVILDEFQQLGMWYRCRCNAKTFSLYTTPKQSTEA